MFSSGNRAPGAAPVVPSTQTCLTGARASPALHPPHHHGRENDPVTGAEPDHTALEETQPARQRGALPRSRRRPPLPLSLELPDSGWLPAGAVDNLHALSPKGRQPGKSEPEGGAGEERRRWREAPT